MVKLIPYLPEHLISLSMQPSQQWFQPHATQQCAEAWANCKHVTTCVGDDRVLAIAGIEEYWPGRALLWSVFSDNMAREFGRVHVLAKRFIDQGKVRRLEAAVEIGFDNGHRWMRALGFELETPCARRYKANGADCAIYVRITE